MTDKLEAFRRKNREQIDRAKRGLWAVAREYYIQVAIEAVDETPGFENQYPPDTAYIPTGRLRGGWNYTTAPILRSSKGLKAKRTEDGPFSDYGEETVERIRDQVPFQPGGISYLENNVGYGFLIVHGRGRHTIKRDFPYQVYLRQKSILARAMANVRFT